MSVVVGRLEPGSNHFRRRMQQEGGPELAGVHVVPSARPSLKVPGGSGKTNSATACGVHRPEEVERLLCRHVAVGHDARHDVDGFAGGDALASRELQCVSIVAHPPGACPLRIFPEQEAGLRFAEMFSGCAGVPSNTSRRRCLTCRAACGSLISMGSPSHLRAMRSRSPVHLRRT